MNDYPKKIVSHCTEDPLDARSGNCPRCDMQLERIHHAGTFAAPECWRIGDVATCLEVMEAAMRAMAPFLPSDRPMMGVDDLIFHSQLEMAEREVERLKTRESALTQWRQAKTQCWGKP